MGEKMKSKRILILLPKPWIDAFRREAKRREMSLGGFLGECTLAQLPKSIRDKLPPRRARGRPVKPQQ
jgi:hypothetical protein